MIQFETDDSEQKIAGFNLTCTKCGSTDTVLKYDFTYYSMATGYEQSISIGCKSCNAMGFLDI